MQRMFYRKDRHCFFLNWLVVVDCLGTVVLSRAGFIGRVHDAVCLQYISPYSFTLIQYPTIDLDKVLHMFLIESQKY